MKVYRVEYGNGEVSVTFATKSVALKSAKTSAREDTNRSNQDETVTVYEETIVRMTKAIIVALINAEGGYVISDRVIATFTRKLETPDGERLRKILG